MAPLYDIAELRRLRSSASESTIALEKAVKEDVVKGMTLSLAVQTYGTFCQSRLPLDSHKLVF